MARPGPERTALVYELRVRLADQAGGMVPADVHRALFPWEVQARTNFAGLEAGVNATAGDLTNQLDDDRRALLDLLVADLAATSAAPGPLPAAVAVAFRVLALANTLGMAAIPGAQALLDQAEARYRKALSDAAARGGGRLQVEAAQQGVDVGAGRFKLGGGDEFRLDLAARRLAVEPHGDMLGAAANVAYRMPVAQANTLIERIKAELDALSTARLGSQYARPAAQQADGIGRQAAGRALPQPSRLYASELLDRNTCGPCSMIDGTEYDTWADAMDDYGSGTYKDCEGGPLCRGTLVSVWDETPPGGSKGA